MQEEIKQRIKLIKNGQVPQGYKKTKVGIVPEDWEVKRLGNIGTMLGGGTPKTSIKEYWEGSIPWISSSDLYEMNIFKLKTNKYITNEAIKNSATKLIPKNSILIVSRVGVGKVAISYQEICTNQDFINITNINQNIIFFGYLILITINKKLKNLQGTSIKGITVNDIKSLLVNIPPLAEQQKIATILTTQDKIIELKQKLIEEKQKQKKYLMQNLLTGKIRLKGFNDKWEKVSLKKILKERKEYSEKSNIYEHVTLSKDGIYPKTERYDRDYLVKDENKKYKITKLNDICYNPANLKFGVICLNSFGTAIFSPIYVTFEIDSKYSIKFISLYLTQWNFINAIRKYEEGTVYERMAVKSEDFILYKLNLPTLQEQNAIAEVLSKADEEIEFLQKDLEQEKEKKKALMQLLLTGIVRV